MTVASHPASLPALAPSGGLRQLWLPLLVFAVLWVDLVRQLSYIWDTNEQYAYGWFVPLLALGLFSKRWVTRPLPQPSTLGFLLSASCFLLCLFLLPLRVIHEINQDWSLCGGILSLSVVALSLGALFLQGGWPWVRHFLFPVCFILVAVRWPYRIEHSLTYRLMDLVASLTVDVLGWLDIPALQKGNLIEVATGTVGVDEACSGIRSLQSTIMAALFLGELNLLPWGRRLLLLAAGVPVAFSLNVARTTFLASQASSSGLGAVDRWHDSAGMTIFLVTFACLFLLAWLLRNKTIGPLALAPRSSDVSSPASGHPAALPLFPVQSSTLNLESLESPAPLLTPPSTSGSLPPLRRYLFAVGLWSLCVLALTELWYRAHESKSTSTPQWSARFPTSSPRAIEIPINPTTRKVLKCDQGAGLSWDEPDGSKWWAYNFLWRAGDATSRMAARDHRPEYCLGATGHNLKADLGIRYLPAHGLQLPFRAYTFENAGGTLHVFFCLWEDGAAKQSGLGRSKYLDRLDSVLAGQRRLGQQTLEIVMSGYVSLEEAEQALRQRLPGLIQLGPAPARLSSLDPSGRR